MKIVITGATGLIGGALCKKWLSEGHEITILSSNHHPKKDIDSKIKVSIWDPEKWHIHMSDLEGADVIVNLAGANIADHKWTDTYKRKILDSRIFSTRCLIKVIERLMKRPKVFLSVSAVGFYGNKGDTTCIEDTAPGNDFLAEVCKAWEREAVRAEDMGIRTAIVRLGMILSPDGGALEKMLPVFKWGLGGRLGSGNQWMSWIHIDDVVKLIDWIANREHLSGVFNGTSPNPVTNKDFTKTLGGALHRPAFMFVPKFVLRNKFGEMSEMLTGGQKVLPQKALRNGFTFQYPLLNDALKNILQGRNS